jgi:predicted dinucleotide-binding enzyme
MEKVTASAFRSVRLAGVVLAVLVTLMPGALAGQPAGRQTPRPMKIGFIGAGNIGGAIGELLAKAGHEVFFSSRNPGELKDLVARIGSRARAGSVNEAIAFGDVVFIGVPYSAMPQIGRDHATALAGKIVMDAGNPSVRRDGAMAEPAIAKGAGVATQEYLPRARIVRAFNQLNFKVFLSEAHREGERVAVPLASDDAEALAVASQLVTDAGFEPVNAGALANGKGFDSSSPLFLKPLTAREMRAALGIPAAGR